MKAFIERNKKKIIIYTFVTLWFLAIVFYLSHVNRQKSVILGQQMQLNAGSIDETTVRIDSESGYGGVFAQTTFGKLNAGIYRVSIKYSSESDYNGVYAFCNDPKLYKINRDILNSNSPMQLYPNRNKLDFHAWVKQPVDGFGVAVNYCGVGTLKVDSVELKRMPNYFGIIVLSILVIALVGVKLGRIRKPGIEKTVVFMTILSVSVISVLPCMQGNLIASTDMSFHFFRIEGIKEALLTGQFPVRIQPNWWGNYGYGISLFYPDLFLYFPALLMMMGLNLQAAYKLFLFGIALGTATTSYYCGKALFGSWKHGLLAASFYTISLYRITNMYQRGALGEVIGMSFLPLIVLGMLIIYRGRQKNELPGWIVLSLGVSGIIESHILTCEMVGFFLLIVVLINIKRLFQAEIIKEFLKSALSIMLLNSWFMVPFLMSWSGNYQFKSVGKFNQEIQSSGAYVYQLFTLFVNGLVPNQDMDAGIIGEMPQSVGIWSLLILMAMLAVIIAYREKIKNSDKYSYILSVQMLGYAILGLFMATNLFPYAWLQNKSGVLESLIGHIQFPWRFLGIATVCLMVGFVCLIHDVELIVEDEQKKQIITLTISAVILTLNLIGVVQCFYVLSDVEGTVHHGFQEYQAGKLAGGDQTEYLLVQCDVNSIDYQKHVMDNGLELPYFYYPLYAVYDEAGIKLETEASLRGLLQVNGVQDVDQQLVCRVQEPLVWRMSELISLLCIAGIMIRIIQIRKGAS